MSRLGAEPIFDSYAAVLAIAAGLLLLLLVRPQFGPLSMVRQLTFLGLRLGVIALVLVALVRPTWITTMREPRTSAVIVLVDTSRSMQLPSGRESLSRWQAQSAALGQSQSALAALAGKKELRLYTYDSTLTPLPIPGGRFNLPDSPKGEQTDIGTALAESLRPEQGKRIAAVVVMGDGSQTAFDPQVETHDAARKLRDDFAAPLYAVTFGPAGDAAQSRDVAVERLDEQFTVFVKNELLVRAVLRVRGYVKQDLPVSLALESEQGQHELIGSRTVRSDEDGRQIEVEFSYTPQKPGRYRLVVAAEPQPGELVVKNNRLDAYLTVLEGGLRVLYLDGEKRFEQKFLRQALNASPDIELDDRIIDRRLQARGGPLDLTADLAAGKYDAFILGDLDAKALGPENVKALADAVGKGKGLLMLGGRARFGRGHYLGTPLGDALPIVIDPLEGAEFSSEPDQFFLAGPVPISPADPHAITRLTSGAGNVGLWRTLPPLNWANKFADVKQAPGVSVLLEGGPQKQPILVSGEYVRGRTLAFAGESTWLWPLAGYEKEHRRFWRQIILWLVKRDDLNRDDVWIKLDQRRFNPGSRVQVAAGARTAAGDPIAGVRLDTVLVRPAPGGGPGQVGPNQREPLKLALDKDEWKGSLTVETPGDYLIETNATTAAGQKLGTARAEFLVFDRDVEFSNPAADPDLMASLAAWTKDEGGRAVAPEELPKLLQELAARPPEYEERETRWKLAGTAIDAWVFFAALVALLSVEWWLRKRWGLV